MPRDKTKQAQRYTTESLKASANINALVDVVTFGYEPRLQTNCPELLSTMQTKSLRRVVLFVSKANISCYTCCSIIIESLVMLNVLNDYITKACS